MISASTLQRLTLGALLLIATYAYNIFFDEFEEIESIAIFIGIVLMGFQHQWIYISLNKNLYLALFIFLGRLSFITSLWILNDEIKSGFQLILLWDIGLLVTAIMSFIFLRTSGIKNTFELNKFSIIFIIKSTPFFISRISASIYTIIPVVLVGSIAGSTAVALFRISDQIFRAGQALISPIVTALYPYLSEKRDPKIFFKWLRHLVIYVALFSIGVSIYSEEILFSMFGQEYSSGASLLVGFMILLIVNFLGTMMGYPAFASISKSTMANSAITYAAAFFIILIIVIYVFSTITPSKIISSMIAAELLVLALRSSKFYREYKKKC